MRSPLRIITMMSILSRIRKRPLLLLLFSAIMMLLVKSWASPSMLSMSMGLPPIEHFSATLDRSLSSLVILPFFVVLLSTITCTFHCLYNTAERIAPGPRKRKHRLLAKEAQSWNLWSLSHHSESEVQSLAEICKFFFLLRLGVRLAS